MSASAPLAEILRGLRDADADTSLGAVARRSGWSPFHFHRLFQRSVGETPKAYTLRLRLERAAARLVAGSERVLDIALDAGFDSHETFTRAFARRFGQTPSQYRMLAQREMPPDVRRHHEALVAAVGPCIGLFHGPGVLAPASPALSRRSPMPLLSIAREEIAPRPALVVRRRVPREAMQAALIGECLGLVGLHAQKNGLAFGGQPFTRYVSVGLGLWTVEIGIPLASPGSGEGSVEAVTLLGGPVVVGVHGGPYDQLADSHLAGEQWIDEQGLKAGAPWEVYTTDPADYPDPADWRTHIHWPLA